MSALHNQLSQVDPTAYNFFDLLYQENLEREQPEEVVTEARSKFFQSKEKEDERLGIVKKVDGKGKKGVVVPDEPLTLKQKLKRAAPYIAGAGAGLATLGLAGYGIKSALTPAATEEERKAAHLRRLKWASFATETTKASDTVKSVAKAFNQKGLEKAAEFTGSLAAGAELGSMLMGAKGRPGSEREEMASRVHRDVRVKLQNEDRLYTTDFTNLKKWRNRIEELWDKMPLDKDDPKEPGLKQIEQWTRAIRYRSSGAGKSKYVLKASVEHEGPSQFDQVYEAALEVSQGASEGIAESSASSRIKARNLAAKFNDGATTLRNTGRAGDAIAKNYSAALSDTVGGKASTALAVTGSTLRIAPLLAQVADGVAYLLKQYGKPQTELEEHAVEMLENARQKIRDKSGYTEDQLKRAKLAIDLLANDPENEVLIYNLERMLYSRGADRLVRKGPGRPRKT